MGFQFLSQFLSQLLCVFIRQAFPDGGYGFSGQSACENRSRQVTLLANPLVYDRFKLIPVSRGARDPVQLRYRKIRLVQLRSPKTSPVQLRFPKHSPV